MRKHVCLSIICLLVFSGSFVCAESNIPNLVGKWKVVADGGVLIKGDKVSEETHRETSFSKLVAEVVVEEQKGRVFKGYFKTKKAKEKIVGVIGFDNKTLYHVDHDGFVLGKLVTPDKVELVYLHAKPSDSVAAIATWERIK